MNLADFPQAIANQQTILLQIEQQLRAARSHNQRLIAGYEGEIAFDKTLTNDAQRKAKRAELFEAQEYQTSNRVIETLSDQAKFAEIELGRLEAEFSIAQMFQYGAIVHLFRKGSRAQSLLYRAS